ncbi:MAG: hypothetical protein V4773_08580 [Verrucomicrobiota bacterium]
MFTAPLSLTLLVCAIILAARRPELICNPQFWAEDGACFFFQAWEFGARTLIEPYAGYLHTTQRIVAAVTVQFDPRWAPTFFVAATMGLTLYVAARTQSSRFPFRPHVTYALAITLVPDTFEVLLFLVNVQWVLAAGFLLLLISSDPRSGWQYAHDIIAACILGLTGPFSVLFLPLFLWRAFQRRTRASFILAGIVCVSAAIQVWTIWRNPVGLPVHRIATESLLAVPGMRIVGSLFFGTWVPPDYPLVVETCLGVFGVVAITALAVRSDGARPERIWLGCAFFALLAASLFRCRYVLPDLCHATYGSRYFFPTQLIFIWLLAAVTADHRRGFARTAACGLLWILAVNTPRLHESALEDNHWTDHAAKLRTGEGVTVPINPGWSFTVSPRKR